MYGCSFVRQHFTAKQKKKKKQANSVAWVRERIMPTELQPLVGEISANILRI
jgi:hypothetical protein